VADNAPNDSRPINRPAITLCVILAVIMQALDTTIANVALPYMQGSVSASADQINWVLTSYIVAAAIMTPPSGFLANRFGRPAHPQSLDRKRTRGARSSHTNAGFDRQLHR
jgi:MFS transporter, DHA2 family, multidrug resistance protein